MTKETVGHKYVGFYSVVKTNNILLFATKCMELEIIRLREVIRHRKKYCMISHKYGVQKVDFVAVEGGLPPEMT